MVRHSLCEKLYRTEKDVVDFCLQAVAGIKTANIIITAEAEAEPP